MDELFQHWASYVALMAEALAVIFIAVGAIEAIWMMLKTPYYPKTRFAHEEPSALKLVMPRLDSNN